MVIGTDSEDHALVRRCLKGDMMAFGELVDRYQKPLFNTAMRMTGDREEAKDLTQTAFVKAYDSLGSFSFRHKFFSWIYRILINETLNWLNSRKSHSEVDLERLEHDQTPETTFRQNRLSEEIDSALVSLSFDQRLVIVLHYFNSMAYKDISCMVGISVGKVKSRLYEARQNLAELLSGKEIRLNA